MAKAIRCPQCGRLIAAGSVCKYCGASQGSVAAGPQTAAHGNCPEVADREAETPSVMTKLKKPVVRRSSEVPAAPPATPVTSAASATPAAPVAPKPAGIPVPKSVSVSRPKPVPTPVPVGSMREAAPAEPVMEEDVTQPKKSKTGLIVGIVIAVVVLVGGGIAAALLLGGKNNEKPVAADSAAAKAEDTVRNVPVEETAGEKAEVDQTEHYNINTIVSGVPVIVKLDITPEGYVTGKYAYRSTIDKYGDKPSSWFSLSGKMEGAGMLEMEASHPDYGNFESWEVALTGEGEYATISGTIANFNTNELFYVGSKRKSEKMYEPNYEDTGEDYMYEEDYEPETL